VEELRQGGYVADKESNKSFWSTIPGILTAFGGIIGSIAALVTALYTAGVLGHKPLPAPLEQRSETAAKMDEQPTVAAKIRDTQPPPRVPTISSGRYVLQAYYLNGADQHIQGEMHLTNVGPDSYRFDTAAVGGTLYYRGVLAKQGDAWYVTVESTNDITALRTPVPNTVTIDENLLTFRNDYGQQFVWSKR
jgi:hypothetical protein